MLFEHFLCTKSLSCCVMYTCPKCSRKLKSKNDYVDHCDGHSIGKKDYPCPNCQFHFRNRASFYTHVKSCKVQKPKPVEGDVEGEVLCRHCKDTFTVKTIETHLRSLPNDIKILCPFCKSGSHPTYNAYTTHKHRWVSTSQHVIGFFFEPKLKPEFSIEERTRRNFCKNLKEIDYYTQPGVRN